jgi:hypothetical protein
VPWLTGTTATGATFTGVPGHSYDFRVAAVDYKGNAQPWLASMSAPGAALSIGGFAQVAVEGLNVRSGAGTTFSSLAQLSSGAVVAVLAGPIVAGGYQWYQVQFAFTEWPSADYPRTGWVAAGSGGTAYLVPGKPPNAITIAPTATGIYATAIPSVVGRYPAPNATGVAATTWAGVRFDRVVSGVGASSFVLRRAGTTAVAATVLDSTGEGLQFQLRPAAPLEAGIIYSLSLTSAITSVEGGQLAPVSWAFTVAGTPPPPTSGPTTYSPPAQLVFKMGTHTGYQFSSSGGMTAVKSYTLPNTQNANTSTRKTITNQSGTWFYVVNGVWAGYWLRQSSVLYLAASPVTATALSNATFSPVKPLVFKMGTHTGYQFSSTGVMTAQKSYTLPNDQSANTSIRKTITNQSGTWYYVVNGVWAGYWLRASDVLYLKP